MRFCWLLLLFFFLQWQWLLGNHLDVARKYLFVREFRPNDSPEIRLFLASVGIYRPASWCAGFVRFVLDEAGVEFPVRSPLALHYKTKRNIPAKWVAKGYKKVQAGWLVIWKRGMEEWKGHIGFVLEWGKNRGRTIEGNVRKGKEEGVFEMEREIYTSKMFFVKWFEPL